MYLNCLIYFLGICWLLNAFRRFYYIYVMHSTGSGDILQRYGKESWAFVTGATSGLGRELSVELAKFKFNVIIHGRNKKLLDEVEELVMNQRVQVIKIQQDLGKEIDIEDYEKKMFEPLKDVDISLVFNNASLLMPEYFTSCSMEKTLQQLYVNTIPYTFISKWAIGKFQKRWALSSKRSALVNIGSIASFAPNTILPAYDATKKYVEELTEGLY